MVNLGSGSQLDTSYLNCSEHPESTLLVEGMATEISMLLLRRQELRNNTLLPPSEISGGWAGTKEATTFPSRLPRYEVLRAHIFSKNVNDNSTRKHGYIDDECGGRKLWSNSRPVVSAANYATLPVQ